MIIDLHSVCMPSMQYISQTLVGIVLMQEVISQELRRYLSRRQKDLHSRLSSKVRLIYRKYGLSQYLKS